MRRLISLLWIPLFYACGGSETTVDSRGQNQFNSLQSATYFLKPFNPLMYALNPASPDNPSTLVMTQRALDLYQYDAIVEPDYADDRTSLDTVITGLGIDAVDLSGQPLTVSIGIEAREYDEATGSFSSNTRIFAAQGEDLSRSQNFVILNTNSPNYLLTGLGFRMKYGRMKVLSLQRKSIQRLGRSSDNLKNGKFVVLPNGWAAIGVYLKFRAPVPEGSNPADVKIPFIQDAIIYTGEWRQ